MYLNITDRRFAHNEGTVLLEVKSGLAVEYRRVAAEETKGEFVLSLSLCVRVCLFVFMDSFV